MSLSVRRDELQIPIFIMRESALVGIRVPELDLSHEYEFRKNINHYLGFVTSGTSISENLKLQDVNTFCDTPSSHSNQSRRSLTLKGFLDNPAKWVPISGYGNWHFQQIPDARVLHGRVIVSQGNFIFTDSSRIPEFAHTSAWPAVVRQTQDGKFETPSAVLALGEEDEAIFIGGTNNFMHFVLEDLPKIVLADKLGLPKDIPIVIRSGLSKQILETISVMSGRRQIQMDTFEEIVVRRLHAFKFTNLLPDAMSGSITAARKLIDPELLTHARRTFWNHPIDSPIERVLIVREKGLFRPLTNAKEIRSALETDFGFVCAELGNTNFMNARNKFVSARLIVGEYGAGLANMIFAHGPTTVIEIRGPLEKDALEYRALSHACGFEHVSVIGKLRRVSKFGIAHGPFKLPVESLRNAITSIGDSFL
jgi:hypothetical protein